MPKKRTVPASRRRLTMPHLGWLLHNKPEFAAMLRELSLKLTTGGRLVPTSTSAHPMGPSCMPDPASRLRTPPASALILGGSRRKSRKK